MFLAPPTPGSWRRSCFTAPGGLVPVNPILPPGLTTDVRPVTLTSQLERLAGFGARSWRIPHRRRGCADRALGFRAQRGGGGIRPGRRAAGAFVIAVTSLAYSRAVQPRQPGMPRLFEIADLVLDNRAPVGDALVELPGLPRSAGAASTVTGAAILNAVVVRAAELLLERTGDAPVFMSANLDGGDAHNQRWLEHLPGAVDVFVSVDPAAQRRSRRYCRNWPMPNHPSLTPSLIPNRDSMSTLRLSTCPMPAADLGPENPLPALHGERVARAGAGPATCRRRWWTA